MPVLKIKTGVIRLIISTVYPHLLYQKKTSLSTSWSNVQIPHVTRGGGGRAQSEMEGGFGSLKCFKGVEL